MKALKNLHPSIIQSFKLVGNNVEWYAYINSGSGKGCYLIEGNSDIEWLQNESNTRWIEQFEDEETNVTNYRCRRWEQEFEQQLNFLPTW